MAMDMNARMNERPRLSESVKEPDTDSVAEPLDISAILSSCALLPVGVARARPTSVVERFVDQSLLNTLTSDASCPSTDANRNCLRERREKALKGYLGKVLTCVFIRLPGIHYTIEIDRQIGRVIHCEWQDC